MAVTPKVLAKHAVSDSSATFGTFAWYVGDLRTGRIATQVPLVGTQWQLVMDDAGTLSGQAYLGSQDVRDLDLWTTAAVAKSFLALAYQDPNGTETFLEGGPIWRSEYTQSTRMLQIGAAGLWSYFDHRKIMPVLGATYPSKAVTTETALSLGTIAKRLMQLAATHTGGNLPIVLPADETGPADADHTRTWNGYELAVIGDALRLLTQDHNGPEIRLQPRRAATDGYLEWALETGTLADPMLHQSDTFFWDATVPKGAVVDVDAIVDGSGMGGRAWVQGNGSEVATLIGVKDDTTLIDDGYPLFELDVPGSTSVETQSTLDATAAAALPHAAAPALTISAVVLRDSLPRLGTYMIGDTGALALAGHDWLPDATYTSRITQISGDDTDKVSVDFAPILGSLV